jgi:hypothetical protein
MTYREIADALLARRQKTLDAPAMAKFVQKGAGGAVFQMKAGAVERQVAIGVGVHDRKQ